MGKGASRSAEARVGRRSPVNTGASWPTPEEAEARVLHHQRKLHKWASTDTNKRFRDLWNLVCDPATLLVAWRRVRDNKGSRTAGVDGVTRHYVVHRVGVERFLEDIRSSLKNGTFKPLPVRERGIPKRGGKVRYLGISPLRDRVVQMALKLVAEPIFESDFYASSYGWRPGRRTQDAIAEIVVLGNNTYDWVAEFDVEACFDRVDRRALMSEVERRVGDRKVLGLIRAFLRAGVMTEAGRLERRLTGTPQGGILSPLLMNVALDVLDREFEHRWEKMSRYRGRRHYLASKGLPVYRLIRYADDYVVLVKGIRAQAEAVMAEVPAILGRMGLENSAAKTRLTHIDEGFTFLGFRVQRRPRPGRRPCVYTFASDEALASIKRKVKALTRRNTTSLTLAQLIRRLNPILRGWAAHFRFAAATRTFSYLGHYVWWRVARWLRKKHKGRTWKWLQRRYRLPGSPQEEGWVLFNPAGMRIIRYRFRGSKIATPWNDGDARGARLGRTPFDESVFLGRLQESLVG